MRHPTDGTLRRLLDEPAGVADTDRAHVADCPVCLTQLTTVREDAALTAAFFEAGEPADVDAGWSRLSRAMQAESPHPVAAPARTSRWRAALRSPVIAVVGVIAVLGGAGAAAAADWIPIFRTETIAPITLSKSDLVGLPDLTAYGDVKLIQQPDVHAVDDATAAQKATGLTLPRLSELPRGVVGDPTYQVAGKVTAQFTFSAEKAAQTAAAMGKSLPAVPPGLDGSQFRLSAGPGTAAVWGEGRGVPALIVARAVAPTAYSSGVPFPTAVGYLLSLPGLPENVASSLRNFTGDGTTLPLPVNSTYLTARTADVGGRTATVLSSRDGVMAGVVWVSNGEVTVVAGSMSGDEALAVARELR
ncbi:hypothetical protein AB0M20_43065 [Actinoplanes sp. NPDC051633]|uniref:hypothetical protein n=1 Tax=Actinoplanes sp. NPDC051633 TaxID=3155670 RepID=UPI0034170E02